MAGHEQNLKTGPMLARRIWELPTVHARQSDHLIQQRRKADFA
jgi:hypothetical protein